MGSDLKACPSRPSRDKRGSSVTTVFQEQILAPNGRYGPLADAHRRGRGLGEGDPGGGAAGLGEENFWTTALWSVLQHWHSQGRFLSSSIVKEEVNYSQHSPKGLEISVVCF